MKNMMLKTSLAVVSILASLANALEEHDFAMEETVINGLDYVLP